MKVTGSNIPVTVRLGTSDIWVFYEIFVKYEYEWGFRGIPEVIVDAGGYTGLSAVYFAGTISLADPGTGAWGLQVTEVDNAVPSNGELIRAVTIDEIITEFNLKKIDVLKVDVEGSEAEIFETAHSWISSVDMICAELHDRFKVGCSRSFFKAVEEFPIELRRNEDVLVARADSRLVSII